MHASISGDSWAVSADSLILFRWHRETACCFFLLYLITIKLFLQCKLLHLSISMSWIISLRIPHCSSDAPVSTHNPKMTTFRWFATRDLDYCAVYSITQIHFLFLNNFLYLFFLPLTKSFLQKQHIFEKSLARLRTRCIYKDINILSWFLKTFWHFCNLQIWPLCHFTLKQDQVVCFWHRAIAHGSCQKPTYFDFLSFLLSFLPLFLSFFYISKMFPLLFGPCSTSHQSKNHHTMLWPVVPIHADPSLV